MYPIISSMAGASGTIYHLCDNLELSFGELKEILTLAASGQLEETMEKVDGINVVFTWNPTERVVKIARNRGDLAIGGMTKVGLAMKFQGRGALSDAFLNAYDVLHGAISSIPDNLLTKIFANGEYWYSAEVVYTAARNVINYDSNNIIFHGSPVIRVRMGQIERLVACTNFDYLRDQIDKMQNAVSHRNWRLNGPTIVSLQRLTDGTVLQTAIEQINAVMFSARVDDDVTLKQYAVKCLMSNELQDLETDDDTRAGLSLRMLGIVGSPTVTQLKRNISSVQDNTFKYLYDNREEIIDQYMNPIEAAVYQFTVELLRGLKSVFIANKEKEEQRIKDEVRAAVQAIRNVKDKREMEALRAVLPKIGKLDNVNVGIEGIVFQYRGNYYKFTGAFGPINALLGMIRYGRANPE